jgi:polyferredoxin
MLSPIQETFPTLSSENYSFKTFPVQQQNSNRKITFLDKEDSIFDREEFQSLKQTLLTENLKFYGVLCVFFFFIVLIATLSMILVHQWYTFSWIYSFLMVSLIVIVGFSGVGSTVWCRYLAFENAKKQFERLNGDLL